MPRQSATAPGSAQVPNQQSRIFGFRQEGRRDGPGIPIGGSDATNQFPTGACVGAVMPSQATVKQVERIDISGRLRLSGRIDSRWGGASV